MARQRRRSKKEKRNRRNILLGGAALGALGTVALTGGKRGRGSSGSGLGSKTSKTVYTTKPPALGSPLDDSRFKSRHKLSKRKTMLRRNGQALDPRIQTKYRKRGDMIVAEAEKIKRLDRSSYPTNESLTRAYAGVKGMQANILAHTSGGRRNASPGIAERIHQKRVLPFLKDVNSRDVKSRISRGIGRLSKQDQKALKSLGFRSQGGFRPGTSKKSKQDAAKIMRSVNIFSRMRRLSYL